MLNSRALDAAVKAYENAPDTSASDEAMQAAITAYLEALLPADVKEVVKDLQPLTKWVGTDTIAIKAAALLQAQAAENAEVNRQFADYAAVTEGELTAKDVRIAELEAGLREIADRRAELKSTHDYSRGWNDALFRAREIARTLFKKDRDNG